MRSRFYIGLAGMALAVALLSTPVRAASVLDPSGYHYTDVTVNGTGANGKSFVATVSSAAYKPGDAAYSTYKGYLNTTSIYTPGGAGANDTIFAYIVKINSTVPSGVVETGFSIQSGTAPTAAGYFAGTGDQPFPFPSGSAFIAADGRVSFQIAVQATQQTGIMVFAVPATLYQLQPANITDGALGQGYVLSDAGPLNTGVDLPLPLAASGGIGLFGLGALRRRVRV